MKKNNRLKSSVVRKTKMIGDAKRPRLTVYRSNAHIYIQLIDDMAKKTLLSVSEKELNKDKKTSKSEEARLIGQLLGQKAKKLKISKIIFDRNRFKYHGRIKALADEARKEGLIF